MTLAPVPTTPAESSRIATTWVLILNDLRHPTRRNRSIVGDANLLIPQTRDQPA